MATSQLTRINSFRFESKTMSSSKGAMCFLLIASLVLLVVSIILFGVTLQQQSSNNASAYSKLCRKFLPENCEKKYSINESTISRMNCDAIIYEDLYDELQLRFGHPTLLQSKRRQQDLKRLVHTLARFAEYGPADKSSEVDLLLENSFIVSIMCALKASVWKTANLITIYHNIGGGGCSSVTGSFVESLKYLISTMETNHTSWDEDVSAISFVLGSIPIAAECSQIPKKGRVNQFIDKLNKL